MGAWGHKNFENDSTLDWYSEYIHNPAEIELNNEKEKKTNIRRYILFRIAV